LPSSSLHNHRSSASLMNAFPSLLICFLWFIFFSPFLGSASSADESLDLNRVNKRQFDFEYVQPTQVLIQAESRNSDFNDSLEITLLTEGAPSGSLFEVEVGYHPPDLLTEAPQLQFTFQLASIVEFADANGNRMYDTGEEVATYGGPKSWNAWAQANTQLPDGTVVYDFTAQTIDQVLTIVAHFATQPTGDYDPNSCEFDIEIHNFPWLDGLDAHPSHQVALVARLVTDSLVQQQAPSQNGSDSSSELLPVQDLDDLDQVLITQPNVFGQYGVLGKFLWVTSFDAESSASSSDVAHILTGPLTRGVGEYELVFSIDLHMLDFVWDPELTVDYTASAGVVAGSWLSFVLSSFRR